MSNNTLFKRRATLVVATAGNVGLDLSQMRFKFKTEQSDVETPNTAVIRVYNLSKETMDAITGKGSLEYTTVILDAGYEDSVQFGTIFNGTIKQFRRGRESNVDSYLDILAADSDIPYNFAVQNTSIPAGSTAAQRVQSSIDAMGIKAGSLNLLGGTLPRGKVLFGLAREILRDEADTQQASWSIQNGALQMIPLTGFLPTEVVVLNSFTGMIGVPEQTDEGIKIRSLLNPMLVVGGRVKINNNDINQIFAQKGFTLPAGQQAFNKFGGPGSLQLPADVSADGIYRLFVAEHVGDTRGNEWYSDLTCLSFDASTDVVPAYG
jgi:hypothetical protein